MSELEQAIEKPFIVWRRKIGEVGAIVSKPWRRHRASVFQGYLIGAVVVFLILAVLAHTVTYFTVEDRRHRDPRGNAGVSLSNALSSIMRQPI